MTLDRGFKLAITQDGRSQKSRLRRWDRRRLCKSVLLEQPEPHAPPLAPDRFRPDLGVVLPGVSQRRAVGETFLADGRFVLVVEEPRVRRQGGRSARAVGDGIEGGEMAAPVGESARGRGLGGSAVIWPTPGGRGRMETVMASATRRRC